MKEAAGLSSQDISANNFTCHEVKTTLLGPGWQHNILEKLMKTLVTVAAAGQTVTYNSNAA